MGAFQFNRRKTMIVYLAERVFNYEGSQVIGIYATADKAVEATIKDDETGFIADNRTVTKMEVQ
jgi:hypothetical protein